MVSKIKGQLTLFGDDEADRKDYAAPETGGMRKAGIRTAAEIMMEDFPEINQPEDQPLRVLSLGAGVQSSAMYLAYLNGDLPDPPKVAVFADTQTEPEAVYDWLAALKRAPGAERIPIIVASRGNLAEDYLKAPQIVAIPFFFKKNGRIALTPRRCTGQYKIFVVQQAVRRILGYKYRERMRHRVTALIGISTDEVSRMKDSPERWITNEFPLIDAEWAREDCYRYVVKTALGAPPKSACVFCPYRSDQSWKEMPAEEFAKAVAFERRVHERPRSESGIEDGGQLYIHNSGVPLDEVDFQVEEDLNRPLFEGFEAECEGMCGV